MKILICHNFYQSRGGEAQTVFRDKELLEKKGHSVILFSRDNEEINNYGLIQKIKLFFGIFFSFKTWKKIKRIIERQRPDIAHVHNVFPLISPSIYCALKKMNVLVVQTVHNYRFLCSNGLFLNNDGKICERCKNGNVFNAVIRKCYRNSYLQTSGMAATLYLYRKLRTFTNKIDVLIAPSNFLRKKLIEGGIPKEKIVVKAHFIKCEEIKPSYEFDNYAVYMGRLSPEKGLFTLLRVWKELPNFTLMIMGDGPIRNELENFVIEEEIANVEFLGFIKGPKRFEILKKAMFMVFPSEWYESFGYAIIESLACGTPVIASRIGGLEELIEEGKNGLLFEPGNIEDLRKKILYFIENPKLIIDMRRYAREIAEKKYSSEVGYKNLMQIHNRLLSASEFKPHGKRVK